MQRSHGTVLPPAPLACRSRCGGGRGRSRGRARDGCAAGGRRPGTPRSRRHRHPSDRRGTRPPAGRTSSARRQGRPRDSRRCQTPSIPGGRWSMGALQPEHTRRVGGRRSLERQARRRSSGDFESGLPVRRTQSPDSADAERGGGRQQAPHRRGEVSLDEGLIGGERDV